MTSSSHHDSRSTPHGGVARRRRVDRCRRDTHPGDRLVGRHRHGVPCPGAPARGQHARTAGPPGPSSPSRQPRAPSEASSRRQLHREHRGGQTPDSRRPRRPEGRARAAPVEGRVSKRIALPHGVDFRAIEVGEATGRIYLAGEAATSQRTKEGGPARSAIAVVLSPEGNVVARRTLRRPGAGGRLGPLDWQVHDIAVSPDEQNVFVSYHGFNTEGADRVAVSGGDLRRCRSRPTVACIARVHGAIDVDAKGLIATTGTPPLLGLFSEEGRPLRSWQSGVARAHLMEFARAGTRALTVESCAKTGGMTVVDLRAGTAQVLHEPAPAAPLRGLPARAICGERISTASGSLIAVMKRGTITGIGGVTLLAVDGDVVEWVPLRPAPVDVHVLPRG